MGGGASGSHKCSHVAHRIFKASKRGMKVAIIFTSFLKLLNCRTPSSPFKIRCWHHIPSLFFSFGCLKSEDLQSTWLTTVKMHIFAIFSRLPRYTNSDILVPLRGFLHIVANSNQSTNRLRLAGICFLPSERGTSRQTRTCRKESVDRSAKWETAGLPETYPDRYSPSGKCPKRLYSWCSNSFKSPSSSYLI